MPYDLPQRTVVVKPGRKIAGESGESLTIIIMPPRCIGDCHAHIESGACVPLPLLWKRGFVPDVDRKSLNFLAKVKMPAAGHLQVKSTTMIGSRLADEITDAFSPQSMIGQSDYYRNSDLYAFGVIHMMDMEYAWIGGFDGETIYCENETPWYFYEREHARDKKELWRKRKLPGENQKTFSKWKDQYLQTVVALKQNPLRIIGMYHYDPRRWNHPRSYVVDNNFQKGPWDHPFKEIISATGKGLFIGFKMYTPLGYKPLDPRLPYLHDKKKDDDCFYARCEQEGIPILAHCSPGGMYTHEMDLYMEYDGASRTPSTDDHMPAETRKRLFTPENYFWTQYVHPRTWREVLARFPKLKLCLAHFGGDEWKRGLESDWITEIIDLTKEYSNVYTDFSCWNLDNAKEQFARVLKDKRYAHLRDKILFGTDWYMTLVALGGKNYRSFCEDFWEFFQELPDWRDLWERFTFINPFVFYGLFEKKPREQADKLDNLVAALKKNECNKEKLNDNYRCIRRVQKEYEKIKSQGGE